VFTVYTVQKVGLIACPKIRLTLRIVERTLNAGKIGSGRLKKTTRGRKRRRERKSAQTSSSMVCSIISVHILSLSSFVADHADSARRRYKKDLDLVKPDLEAYNRQKEAALGFAPGALARSFGAGDDASSSEVRWIMFFFFVVVPMSYLALILGDHICR
jgi:hypothetical protein